MEQYIGQSPTALTLAQLMHDYVSGKLTPAITFMFGLKTCNYLIEGTGQRCIIGQYMDRKRLDLINEYSLVGVNDLLELDIDENPFSFLADNVSDETLELAQTLHDDLVTEDTLTKCGIDPQLRGLHVVKPAAWLSSFDKWCVCLDEDLMWSDDYTEDAAQKLTRILDDTRKIYVQNYEGN